MKTIEVGLTPALESLHAPLNERRQVVTEMRDKDLDHLGLIDHVSFRDGFGTDALIEAAGVAGLDDHMPILVSAYVLGLRHPTIAARQLASLEQLAPGRIRIAVGIGGEDRAEIANCGVDPASRGRRTDECIEALLALLAGEPVTVDGQFIRLDGAHIRPGLARTPEVMIAGRSTAAVERAGRLGTGWMGLWVSPRRFAQAVAEAEAFGLAHGRGRVPWRHGLTVWCGIGRNAAEGEAAVRRAMEALYRSPFEQFAKWTPSGTPAEIASALAPYIDAGCSIFNLIARAGTPAEAINGVAEIRRLLQQAASLPRRGDERRSAPLTPTGS